MFAFEFVFREMRRTLRSCVLSCTAHKLSTDPSTKKKKNESVPEEWWEIRPFRMWIRTFAIRGPYGKRTGVTSQTVFPYLFKTRWYLREPFCRLGRCTVRIGHVTGLDVSDNQVQTPQVCSATYVDFFFFYVAEEKYRHRYFCYFYFFFFTRVASTATLCVYVPRSLSATDLNVKTLPHHDHYHHLKYRMKIPAGPRRKLLSNTRLTMPTDDSRWTSTYDRPTFMENKTMIVKKKKTVFNKQTCLWQNNKVGIPLRTRLNFRSTQI